MADFRIDAIFDTSDLKKGARDIKKFNDSLQAGTKETNKDLKRTEKQAKKAGKSVGSFFKQLAVGFLAIQGARALINFGQDLRELSAEMEVINQRARIVFGTSFPRMQRTAATLGARIGLTKNEFVGLASGVQDLLVPLGFTRETATALTENVAILGASLAEFNNIQGGAAEGIKIVNQALLGQRERLEALGIKILESDVSNRLLLRGQEKLTGQALKQAKVIATLELITESGADAIDKFGQSASNQATQMAKADAAFRQAQETLANRLQPVIIAFNTLWLAAGEAIADLVEEMGEIDPEPIVNFLFDATIGVIKFFQSVAPVVDAVTKGIGAIFAIVIKISEGVISTIRNLTKENEDNNDKTKESTFSLIKVLEELRQKVLEGRQTDAEFDAAAKLAANQAEIELNKQLISLKEKDIILTKVSGVEALKAAQKEIKAVKEVISFEQRREDAEERAQEKREERFAANAAMQIANVQSLADAGKAALEIIKREVVALIIRSILDNVLIPFPFNIAVAGGAGAIASGLFSQVGFKKGGFVPEFATGGFVSGGFTGNAPESEVAGQVHGGEIVIPRSAVKSMMNGANFDQAMSGTGDGGTLQNIEELLREDRTIIIKNELRAIDFIDLIEKGEKDKTAIKVQ